LTSSGQLETDQNLLLPKARQALERYGHQVVIGNDLHRRKFEVVFVSKARAGPPGLAYSTDANSTGFVESWLRIDIPENPAPGEVVKEIEEDIIKELYEMHQRWIEDGED